jgi:hypothetical protein
MKGILSIWNPTFVPNACAFVPVMCACLRAVVTQVTQGTPP